ncbi:MAG: hypothetical protein A2Z96_08005 [Spirochaetes bacterium GWB1_48_6]|nr:MAG: hypothetical protein A2Z96_08005 [Spirochaetes bacterium GWB1_48_6]
MLHFAFQVVQLFTMSHFYGLQLGGLAARTPGLFLVPNSAAFFSTFFLFLALYGEERQKTFSVVMALASVFLTQSGTGIVICVILIYLKAVPKKFTPVLPWFLFSGCVGVILMFFAFSPALGRGSDYIAVSGGTRLRIFLDALARSNFLSYTFGAGTNSSQLLGFTEFAVDSIYASIVINLGWGALLIILIIAAITIFKNRKRKRNTAFMLMYGLFGATTIFLEAFPMNYLFSLMAVVYFGRKKSRFEIKFVERRQAARMAIFSKQANKDYKWNP